MNAPVPKLAELQAQFQAHVLCGTPGIAARLRGGPRGRVDERLAVYAEGYRVRLIEALGEELPALSAYMGESLFRTACHRYLEAHPSTCRNLRWYGAGFADWLAATAPWQDVPLLAEIARFEWTLSLAFDAPDEPPATMSDLMARHPDAWAGLHFALHPAAHLLDLHGNAPEMRSAADAGGALPPASYSDRAVTWLIWRENLVPHFESLADREAQALRAAAAGASFGEVCEITASGGRAESAASAAAGWLGSWLARGLLCLATEHPPPTR